jgi:DNA-binding SARP family transcriptional activator/DNA-binding beta-propeller fold protein YncE
MPDDATSDFNHEGRFAFRLLGALEISLNGRPRVLPRRKQRLLLTLLLLSQEEVVSIDRLVDQLWGERPPKTAVGALQNLVSEVRKALGSSVVRTHAAGYSLGVERESVDIYRFERLVAEAGDEESAERRAQRLREALALWRGPPLLEFAGEPFAQVEIARLHELRIVAREALAEAELELGHHARLVGELEALVVEEPLRERLRAQLMIALYRSGRQAEALATYRDARRMLADELGLEPSDELQQLERAILTQDQALAAIRSPEATHRLAAGATRASAVPPRRRGTLRPRMVAAAIGALVLAAAIAVIGFTIMRESGGVSIVPNSVAIVDVQTSRLVGDIPLGGRPGAIVFGAGAIWVANADDGTIARIAPTARKVIESVRLGTDIRDLAIGFGSIWAADGKNGTVTRVDLADLSKTTVRLGRGAQGSVEPVSWVAVGADVVWATRGNTLVQIDPTSNEVSASTRISSVTGLAAGLGAAWVVTDDQRLLQIAPARRPRVQVVVPNLAHRAIALAVGAGSVWLIVDRGTGQIWRVDPDSGAPRIIEGAGRHPLDLAVAEETGDVWAVDSTGAVIRINPNIELAVEQIRTAADIHSATAIGAGLAVGAGLVWIAVPE